MSDDRQGKSPPEAKCTRAPGDLKCADKREASKEVTVTWLVGQFGWWQANIAAFYFTAYILTTFNNLGVSFHAAKTDYRCVQWADNRSANEVPDDRIGSNVFQLHR